VHEAEGTLYIRQEDGTGWNRHIRQPDRARRHHWYYLEGLVHSELPAQGYIEVIAADEREQVGLLEEPTVLIWDNIVASRDSIMRKVDELLCPIYLESSGQLDIFFYEFSSGQLVAVSDGSYFPDIKGASAAWIIESRCKTQWIRGSILTPGPLDELSAYRSELTGLLAITITFKILACCLPQPRHAIIGCDGEAALQ